MFSLILVIYVLMLPGTGGAAVNVRTVTVANFTTSDECEAAGAHAKWKNMLGAEDVRWGYMCVQSK
jgi:hypothetical protein